MMSKNRLAMLVGLVAVLTLAVSSTLLVAQEAAKVQTLTIEGSTTVGPISDAYKEYFEKQYTKNGAKTLEVTVKNTGSGNGITALLDGRCDIATSSRFMKKEEFAKAAEKGVMPVAHVIALDAICVIVNPNNKVLGLSTAQIKDIYMGKIKNWKDVGGEDLEIVAISRDISSGTYEAFHELAMNKEKMADSVQTVSSSNEAHAKVSTTKGAIAYVGLGFLDEKVRGVNVDGITPSKKTIIAGKYPLSRPLFLFTNGYPKLGSLVYEVCTFHLTEAGQKIVEAKGYVPLTSY